MTFLKKLYQHRKVYFLWLLSYLCIFLIPIIASSLYYFQSLNMFEHEISRTNNSTLNQMKQVIDGRLIETQQICQQISLDPNIQKFMYLSPAEAKQPINLIQALSNFNIYRASSSFFSDFFVLYRNLDLALSLSTQSSKELIYKMRVTDSGSITEDAWENVSNMRTKSGFYLLSTNKSADHTESNFAYVQTLPILELTKPLATLVVEVNNHELYKTIEALAQTNRSTIYIVNKDNTVLSSTNHSSLIDTIKYEDLAEDSTVKFMKEKEDDYVVSYIKSDVTSWKYVIITPKNLYSEKLIALKNISYVCYVISFILGIFATFYLLRKNYKPLRDLLQTLSHTEHERGNTDEFHYISDTFKKTIYEQKKISDKLEKQNQSLQYGFLANLLRGRVSNKISIDKAFSTYHIRTLSNHYSVILLFIEDFSGFIGSDESPDTSVDNMDLLLFIMRNVMEELAGEKHLGYVTEVDNMICCLVNINPEYMGDAQNDLLKIATDAQQFFKDNLQIYFTASVSEILTDYSGITSAYNQAMEAMEYRMITGGNRIISYADVKKAENNHYYEYDLETENQLFNSVKAGNYENAVKIMTSVFENNFIQKSPPAIQLTKFLVLEIMSTIMKAIREINIVYDNYFLEEMYMLESLTRSNDMEEIKNAIWTTLEKVCTYIQKNKKTHNERMKNEIQQIMEENYHNDSLNLQYVADRLNLGPSYLSKIFKDELGLGFVDYLHMLRIKEGKELLRTTNLPINEIASKVGYCSSNTFIRTFKKNEGITPGQYKDSIVNE